MKIEELEAKVDLFSLIEQNHTLKRIGRGKAGMGVFQINPCPKCSGNDHFTVYPETNSYSSFSHCCTGGSVYKYLQEVDGMSEEEAHKELHRLAGEENIPEFNPNKKGAKSHQPTKAEGEAPVQDHTALIIEAYHKQTEEDKAFFLNRGISTEIMEKYKLIIRENRAVLPIWSGGKVVGYTGRAIREGQEPKYQNSKGSAPLFNIDYLHQATKGDIIVITEGIFDALSVEAAGLKAIALGGVEHAGKLTEAIEASLKAKDILFLTAFDNDSAGQAAADKLGYRALRVPSPYKDLNEWHVANPRAFAEGLRTQATRPYAVSDYLNTAFVTDIEKLKTYKDKKTGFSNLDKEMNGLYAGLYVVGGVSSLGKTTLIHQIGDQLAEQGEHIIYFSLEQSKLEMVSKSLARITAKTDYKNAVPGISIRSGYIPNQVIKAAESYENTAQRVNIIEGNFDHTATYIREEVERYMAYNKVKPVVIIDYLQIIPGDGKSGDKQRVDNTVTELKRISRDNDLIVFVISSLNRGGYLTPIDFESFKESGGIEYTADVVWGLQLQVINDELFNKEKNLKEKREKLREAKEADPRKVELVCLKNRNGKPSFSCNFTYYPKYDYFQAE